MKIFYCNNCDKIKDAKEIFEEVCSKCGKIKKSVTEIMPIEHSDVDNLIINQNVYNMMFGTNPQ